MRERRAEKLDRQSRRWPGGNLDVFGHCCRRLNRQNFAVRN